MDVVLYGKVDDLPKFLFPARTLAAFVTEPYEFRGGSDVVELNYRIGSNLIGLKAVVVPKDYFLLHHYYKSDCMSMDKVSKPL